MKKLLSLILAITMIAAFIPTTFATDGEATTVTYVFTQEGKGVTSDWLEQITKATVVDQVATAIGEQKYNSAYATTDNEDPNKRWAYLGTNVKYAASGSKKSTDYPVMLYSGEKYFLRTHAPTAEQNDWVALKIKVPVNGNYKVINATAFCQTNASSNVDIYILPMDLVVTTNDTFNGQTLSEVFAHGSAVYGSFIINTETNTTLDIKAGQSLRVDAKKFNELGISEDAKKKCKAVSINANNSKSATKAESANAELTNAQAIELEGDTEYILLLCNMVDSKAINIESLTLTAEPEAEQPEEDTPVELSGNIAFAAGANVRYKIGNGTYTSISANNTVQIPVASSVTVKVTDTEDFAGWVRGTKDSGVWVSSDPKYEFYIMSPTYLTPVYTTPEETATHAVEFWDENGAYVETVTATDGKAVFPDEDKYGLVGGSFNGWWLNETTKLLAGDDVAEGITRAVARYDYGNFGTKVPNSEASAKYWKRGDDIVAYGSTYDFYQWSGEPTITFGTDEIENKPLVVLDSTPVDGAYMIEYDKGNASEVVEAGILFGSDTDINIGSTDGSKAASQRNENHGQFCAKPNTESNYNYARGYLIYKGTDSKLYVIYTAAVATATSAQ